MKLLGIEIDLDEFDRLICEQNNGKELKVVNGKVIAIEHEISEEEIISNLRNQREFECFPVINRGKLWYDNLTEEQLIELNKWYRKWLDVTLTKEVPERPVWIG